MSPLLSGVPPEIRRGLDVIHVPERFVRTRVLACTVRRSRVPVALHPCRTTTQQVATTDEPPDIDVTAWPPFLELVAFGAVRSGLAADLSASSSALSAASLSEVPCCYVHVASTSNRGRFLALILRSRDLSSLIDSGGTLVVRSAGSIHREVSPSGPWIDVRQDPGISAKYYFFSNSASTSTIQAAIRTGSLRYRDLSEGRSADVGSLAPMGKVPLWDTRSTGESWRDTGQLQPADAVRQVVPLSDLASAGIVSKCSITFSATLWEKAVVFESRLLRCITAVAQWIVVSQALPFEDEEPSS